MHETFDWEGPFQPGDQLSDEERQVLARARGYAQDELAPRVQGAFRHERTDPAIFREMGGIALLGSSISADDGGSELGYVADGLDLILGRAVTGIAAFTS